MPMLKMKRVHPNAMKPVYGTNGAACFDFYSTTSGVVPAGGRAVFGTGLAFEIPEGYVMQVFSRSGQGFKHGIRMCNGTGIIDSDYRGEVRIGLHNDSDVDYEVRVGDRIAQGMLIPVGIVIFKEVDTLSETERGEGGYGSTGR